MERDTGENSEQRRILAKDMSSMIEKIRLRHKRLSS